MHQLDGRNTEQEHHGNRSDAAEEIRLKLSLEPSLSLRVEERPTPIAIIKGTVIGPVVTPPGQMRLR